MENNNMNMDFDKSVEDAINQLKLLMINSAIVQNKSVIAAPNVYQTIHLENWTKQYYKVFEKSTADMKIVVIFFYSLIVLVSFFGNLIVCKIVFCRSAMRSTTNIYIGNLSISDLLMTVFNIPLQLIQILSQNWPMSQFLCRCMPFFQGLSVNVSSFTMTCIALDRYHVIAHPLKPRPGTTSVILKLSFIWFMAILASSPYPALAAVEDDFTYIKITRCRLIYPEPRFKVRQAFTLIMMIIQYLGPLSITGFTYYKICIIIWNRKTIGVMSERQKYQRYMAKWKTIKMLLVVVLVFIVCWLPLNAYHIYQDFRGVVGVHKHNPIISLFCHWFAMSSVCYNPFVYCWLNDGFRTKVKACLLLFWPFKSKCNTNLNAKTKSDKVYKHSSKASTKSTSIQSKYLYGLELAQICTTKVYQSSNKLKNQKNFNEKEKHIRSLKSNVEIKRLNVAFTLEIDNNFINERETEL